MSHQKRQAVVDAVSKCKDVKRCSDEEYKDCSLEGLGVMEMSKLNFGRIVKASYFDHTTRHIFS